MTPSWDDAPLWARFVSMDDNGRWYWYEKRPVWEPITHRWLCSGGEYEECRSIDTDPGNGTLQVRTHGEYE